MNNVALITGASSGIGKALAFYHASKGGDLIIVSRKLKDLHAVKKEIEATYKVEVLCIAKDLSLPSSCKDLYNEVKKRRISIQYLMNNAGFGGQGYFHKRDLKKDLSMIQVNIVALTELTRLFLQDFIDKGQGKILNTSSTASLMPGPLQAVYYASKAYVTSFSNALSCELEHTKITVTALLPGATESNFGSTSGMSNSALFKKTVSPDIVAKDGYEAMLQGKLNVVSGLPLTLRVSIALTKFLPKKIVLKFVKQQQSV